jgi:hypothetical protein
MKNLIAFLLALTTFTAYAQNQKDSTLKKINRTELHLGLGLGLDYGGLIGIQLNVNPHKNIGLFGGIGYALIEIGFNAGAKLRILPEAKFNPYISGMYGYNAVIKIEGASEYNKMYYGPSFGLGCEIWGNTRKGYFNVELIIPVRSQQFTDEWDAIKNNPGIEIKQDILPVAFSFGYNFKL